MRTSIKVSNDTYEMIIKTRGIFEQLFRRKLSLDETMYLSARLISFIYENVQRLQAQNRIKIHEVSAGTVNLEGLENMQAIVQEITPDVVDEFTDINQKLAEKEKKTSRLMVSVKKEEG